VHLKLLQGLFTEIKTLQITNNKRAVEKTASKLTYNKDCKEELCLREKTASEREGIRQGRVIRYALDSLSPIEIASP
jgi:hypothetical protein